MRAPRAVASFLRVCAATIAPHPNHLVRLISGTIKRPQKWASATSMLVVSGCSVEKQAIGEVDQRFSPALSHSINEAKAIPVSQLCAVIAD
jgi:hypothetical protein